MPETEIRSAADADLARLRVIFREASWSNEGDRPLFAEHPEFLVFDDDAVREGRTRVATAGGRLVGFATVAHVGTTAELVDLFVDPAAMRRGVARALLADAGERARRAGADRIEVDANDHARSFYLAVGFVDLGRVPLEHGTATRMVLSLRP